MPKKEGNSPAANQELHRPCAMHDTKTGARLVGPDNVRRSRTYGDRSKKQGDPCVKVSHQSFSSARSLRKPLSQQIDALLGLFQETIEDALVFSAGRVFEAAAEVAGFDFQTFDLGNRLSFRVVNCAHE